jgi:hypothetical protein
MGDLMNEFTTKVSVCKERASGMNKTEVDCNPRDVLEIEGFGPRVIGPMIGGGLFGRTFEVANAPLIFKVLRNHETTLCVEQVGLELLDSLSGFAPKTFGILSGIDPRCAFGTIVMERLGTEDWEDVVKSFDSGFYLRFARLIEAVKQLHEWGFIHKDLKGDNVRVKRDDPDYAALIDFGLMTTVVDPKTGGHHPRDNRRLDMVRVAMMAEEIFGFQPEVVRNFDDEIRRLKADERPEYEKWITYFRAEGLRLKDLEKRIIR